MLVLAELTRHGHSINYCVFAPHICGVVLRAHPFRDESHIQRNANGEVARRTILKTQKVFVRTRAYECAYLN